MTLSDYLSETQTSVAAFAELVGLSAEAVRLYLKDQRHPSAASMRRIYEATGGRVTPNDFMVGGGGGTRNNAVA